MAANTPERGDASQVPHGNVVHENPGKEASYLSRYFPMCTTWYFDEKQHDSNCTGPREDTHSAWVPENMIWTGRGELGVKFLSTIPCHWTYAGSKIDIEKIMSWANEWRSDDNGAIPNFTLVRDPKTPADINVEFTSNGRNESKIGNSAETVVHNNPTMWLCLHAVDDQGHPAMQDSYKKHLVIHEFGHALGLGHEHQRSDFWENIMPYLDEKIMKSDLIKLGLSEETIGLNWHKTEGLTTENSTPYDPLSVMHYWFKKTWLTHGYSDMANVVADKNLSDKVKNALLGVHERDSYKGEQCVATKPSQLDIQLLKDLYNY